MKTIVSVNEVLENKIKPQLELTKWKQIVIDEIKEKWSLKKNWIDVNCPLCNTKNNILSFKKYGFEYNECNNCKTLYSKNRPNQNELRKWYTKSKSTNFWKDKLLSKSKAYRNSKIIQPRFQWILDCISEYLPNSFNENISFIDISFFGKMLIEKISVKIPNSNIISAGLTETNKHYNSKNIIVNPIQSLEDFSHLDAVDIVLAFDVFDKAESISKLIDNLENIVKPGGLLFATSLVSSGFEIQSLWDHSPSIIPPDKLNLPSVNGLINFFNKSNEWKLLELSTPGMLDLEIVKKEVLNNSKKLPRVLHSLLGNIDKQGEEYFIEYLQSQRLSSFSRILIKREY